ncbi:MAG: BrnT family toxin [Chloroflexota bacterium]|nr:BrnT family toxin [Chloroflexota bacterium]
MQDFEWDPAKDSANQEKHGIGFADAVAVFDDPDRLEVDSSRPEYGEERRKTIGRIGATVAVVISTDRQGRRRIISARRASRDERRQYDQGTATP